jgi:hypothetical protein
MNSLTTKGSGFKKRKSNVNWKKDKHYYHLIYGCNRIECLRCFHGFPYQMHINLKNSGG